MTGISNDQASALLRENARLRAELADALADRPEVVRCENCAHRSPGSINDNFYWCNHLEWYVGLDWFCGDWKKKP